jgi:hypothetical protein
MQAICGGNKMKLRERNEGKITGKVMIIETTFILKKYYFFQHKSWPNIAGEV